MNIFAIIIITAIIIETIIDFGTNYLNLRNLNQDPPKDLEGIFDSTEYTKSQKYNKTKTIMGFVSGIFFLSITLCFWFLGGFNSLDILLRKLEFAPLVTGLIYCGILFIASSLLSLPFSIYSTFVIEEKFGFNKTTVKTFILDMIKGLLLTIVLGGFLLTIVLFLFGNEATSQYAWILCWIGIILFTTLLRFIAPTWIMPLFNKFTPLENGELREKIEKYSKSVGFSFGNIFVIDGSKRSSHSNAFFTGFGPTKRIALFDTLLQQNTNDEILAILGHEIAHQKCKHILITTIIGFLTSGIIFFLLSFLINQKGLYDAFYMDYTSIYTGIIFFSFLYIPIELVTSIFGQYLSRKHEYEADKWACINGQDGNTLISALKKLSSHNLSNLTPHPLYVFFNYTHPPLYERIKAIKSLIINKPR